MTSSPETASKKRTLLAIFIPLVLILVAAWGALTLIKSQVQPKTGQNLPIEVGTVLPDLELHRVGGEAVHLSDLHYRVLLINFWATWCEACMEEMPSLVQLHDTHRGRGLEVAGINLDEGSAKAIASTTQQFKIGFSHYIDLEGQLSDHFDVHAIPLTITIDSTRKVLEIQAGDRDWMSADYWKKVEGWLGN